MEKIRDNYYAIIMAGGVGSRFWPLSTERFPKQFHDILGSGKSLIQQTFNRVSKLVLSENIFIATNEKYKDLVLSHLSSVDKKQLFLEPQMKNTAPAILVAALKIYRQNPDAVMLVAPSDHWIDKEDKFIENVKNSFEVCSKEDILMTLGIKPTNPNTGYGYIEFEKNTTEIKKVKKFTEKPSLEKAKSFLKNGNYLWNAGIFVWSAKSILKAFKKYLPDMFALLSSDNKRLDDDFIIEKYPKSESISIDFGIMERAKNVSVLPVSFGWSDLGTWDSLYRQITKQGQKNAVIGAQTILRDSKGNIISTSVGKKVIVQGLDNFIVVEKDDTLLICPREQEQDIKEISRKAKTYFSE